MKVVSENTLRTRMPELFREIEATGEELLVTDNGELVLKIISYRRYFGECEGSGEDHGVNR